MVSINIQGVFENPNIICKHFPPDWIQKMITFPFGVLELPLSLLGFYLLGDLGYGARLYL